MQQVNDIAAKVAVYHDEIKDAIDRVLKRGWFVLGPEVQRFEKSFADYLGASYCIGVANGTDAIELALKAVGVGVGDRVATVANAGMYTTTSLLTIGATAHFMDVDFHTRTVTLQEVIQAVEKGVKAVVVTHLYGLAVPEIVEIAEYCEKRKIPLVEDCAQAHGAKRLGRCVGTFGDVGCFSFYPTKNLGALGDGGAVVTNSSSLNDKLRQLRQYGWVSKYTVGVTGACNSRLDEMQAAILSTLLPHLDVSNQKRRAIAARYTSCIRSAGITPPDILGEEYVAHLYVIAAAHRDQLRTHLSQHNIGSDVHYPIPDYRQPIFQGRFQEIHLPNTERLAQEILTLPCYPELSMEKVDAIISVINDGTP